MRAPKPRSRGASAARSTVDAYLAMASPDARRTLERLRGLIRGECPTAIESIRYGMPYYTLNGKAIAGFAGFKDHVSLFGSLAGHERDFAGFETGRGTVRFPIGQGLPVAAIRRFLRARIGRIERTT